MESTLNLANFYAVELLHAVFNTIDPPEKEISQLERQLQKNIYKIYRRFYSKAPCKLRILIVSSSDLEQNTLLAMLKSKKCLVDQAHDKESLIGLLMKKRRYDAVIVSDDFEYVGLGFFPVYFRGRLSKYMPRLIYLGDDINLQGFHAQLRHPFLTDEVLRLIMPYYRGK